ncbi:hypothetical protein HGG75_14935 [Ochrobactrum pseudogrignonense]|nr:hypothetical protein [Brucella pseudogrignonensis]
MLVLWGNNTYSGNTYVSGGILQIASMQNLGASSNTHYRQCHATNREQL